MTPQPDTDLQSAAPANGAHAPRVLSGVQPTGELHLGNYLGALKRFAALQDARPEPSLFCIVDLHAITLPQDPARLAANTRSIAAAFIASGLDPQRSVLFPQSAVREHTELAWTLNCTARMGWLERMTQFKDKSGKDAERASVGLFTYPVLQAADILLYRATHVPVGEDQKQHLELSRDIADRFNRDFAEGFFPLPEPIIQGPGARIMSLKDASKKMSKSDPSALSRINLEDDAEVIAKKLRKARTDAEPVPDTEAGLEGRPEAANLVRIQAALEETSVADVLAAHGGEGWGAFKPRLAEIAVERLAPVTRTYKELLAGPGYLDHVLNDGAKRARAIAAPVMAEVRKAVGFWQPAG